MMKSNGRPQTYSQITQEAATLSDAAFFSKQAASHIVSLPPPGLENLPISSLTTEDPLVRTLNSLLDYILEIIIAEAGSTGLNDLRTAVEKILPSRFGIEALNEAHAELETYRSQETENGRRFDFEFNSRVRQSNFNAKEVWKRARIRCMIYSTVGEREDSDFPSIRHDDDMYITPAVAIYLTAILEFIGEHILLTSAKFTRQRMGRLDVKGSVQEQDLNNALNLEEVLHTLWSGYKQISNLYNANIYSSNTRLSGSIPDSSSLKSVRSSTHSSESNNVVSTLPFSQQRLSTPTSRLRETLNEPDARSYSPASVPGTGLESATASMGLSSNQAGVIYVNVDTQQSTDDPDGYPIGVMDSTTLTPIDEVTRSLLNQSHATDVAESLAIVQNLKLQQEQLEAAQRRRSLNHQNPEREPDPRMGASDSIVSSKVSETIRDTFQSHDRLHPAIRDEIDMYRRPSGATMGSTYSEPPELASISQLVSAPASANKAIGAQPSYESSLFLWNARRSSGSNGVPATERNRRSHSIASTNSIASTTDSKRAIPIPKSTRTNEDDRRNSNGTIFGTSFTGLAAPLARPDSQPLGTMWQPKFSPTKNSFRSADLNTSSSTKPLSRSQSQFSQNSHPLERVPGITTPKEDLNEFASSYRASSYRASHSPSRSFNGSFKTLSSLSLRSTTLDDNASPAQLAKRRNFESLMNSGETRKVKLTPKQVDDYEWRKDGQLVLEPRERGANVDQMRGSPRKSASGSPFLLQMLKDYVDDSSVVNLSPGLTPREPTGSPDLVNTVQLSRFIRTTGPDTAYQQGKSIPLLTQNPVLGSNRAVLESPMGVPSSPNPSAVGLSRHPVLARASGTRTPIELEDDFFDDDDSWDEEIFGPHPNSKRKNQIGVESLADFLNSNTGPETIRADLPSPKTPVLPSEFPSSPTVLRGPFDTHARRRSIPIMVPTTSLGNGLVNNKAQQYMNDGRLPGGPDMFTTGSRAITIRTEQRASKRISSASDPRTMQLPTDLSTPRSVSAGYRSGMVDFDDDDDSDDDRHYSSNGKKIPAREESLSDFLRDSEPPNPQAVSPPRRIIPSKQKSPSPRKFFNFGKKSMPPSPLSPRHISAPTPVPGSSSQTRPNHRPLMS